MIENYKCFKGKFSLNLNPNINIIAGDNEAGKSTIIEAVYLALTGVLHGKYLKNNINSYIFNNELVAEYVNSIKDSELENLPPPYILIELYFTPEEGIDHHFSGNKNTDGSNNACGIYFKIEFDEEYASEYAELIDNGEISSVPVEYYKITWSSFARDSITSRSIPIKPAIIDSSTYRFKSGSDVFISQIVSNILEEKEKVAIIQEHRKFQDTFADASSIKSINEKIKQSFNILNKKVEISVDMSSHNAWQNSLMTYLEDVPFHHASKGEQGIIKTELAINHSQQHNSSLLLIEEIENHLSFSRLNEILHHICRNSSENQIIISTHSSFVANKLGFNNITLLNKNNVFSFSSLEADTFKFFMKLAGYDTLRLLLCTKAVLVEGPSDELIFQKAYLNKNGKLPIEAGIDVISVGLTFKRFLNIAKSISKKVAVITDNDGDYTNNIQKKYADYATLDFIKICASNDNTKNTLEVHFYQDNIANLALLKKILKIKKNGLEIRDHMLTNKTEWALNMFEYEDTEQEIVFPQYILDAVSWCDE